MCLGIILSKNKVKEEELVNLMDELGIDKDILNKNNSKDWVSSEPYGTYKIKYINGKPILKICISRMDFSTQFMPLLSGLNGDLGLSQNNINYGLISKYFEKEISEETIKRFNLNLK